MFDRIRARLRDMGTIKLLCEKAEMYALQDQQREPGAEHFLLAAFDLPDDTARLVFYKIGVEPSALKVAIERQYDDALRSVGLIDAAPPGDTPLLAHSGTYQAAPSGQEIMQKLATNRKNHGPLLGAHVVGVIADIHHGVTARTLRTLGIDPTHLKSAADAIVGTRPNR